VTRWVLHVEPPPRGPVSHAIAAAFLASAAVPLLVGAVKKPVLPVAIAREVARAPKGKALVVDFRLQCGSSAHRVLNLLSKFCFLTALGAIRRWALFHPRPNFRGVNGTALQNRSRFADAASVFHKAESALFICEISLSVPSSFARE